MKYRDNGLWARHSVRGTYWDDLNFGDIQSTRFKGKTKQPGVKHFQDKQSGEEQGGF